MVRLFFLGGERDFYELDFSNSFVSGKMIKRKVQKFNILFYGINIWLKEILHILKYQHW